MIFLDTNIFMYAAGEEHPYKTQSLKLLEYIAMDEIEVAINVEVIQEILHRYTHIKKKKEGLKLARSVMELIDKIYSVETMDIDKSISILEKYNVKARDAIHAATCQNRGIKHICTYDEHFDEIRYLERKEPDDLIEEIKLGD